MKYEINQSQIMYDVVETETKYIVKSFPLEKYPETRKFCKHLNRGAAFDGQTPKFFQHRFEKYAPQ